MNYNISDFLIGSGTKNICIVGLGYVGLPLAILFSKKYNVYGFDNYKERIEELKNNYDRNEDVSIQELQASYIKYISLEDIAMLRNMDVFIVTVPTPIHEDKQPDLTPIISATKTISTFNYSETKKKILVIYESTVYPGVTEEICVPLLSKENYVWKKDFHVGYSPERINPGDKVHCVKNTNKIVSGDDEETAKFIYDLYGSVIEAKIHMAPNIRTAEAAKVIENVQRDLNIALVNELALIFHKMNIDTQDVLAAAGTKWNFHKYEPGLVGGHCFTKNHLITIRKNNIIKTQTIKEYVNGFEKENSDEILSFDVDSRKLLFSKISGCSKATYDKIVTVTTEKNHKISVTDKHPLLVFENEKLIVKHAENIAVGDKIPLFYNKDLPQEQTSTNIDLINVIPDSLISKTRVKLKSGKWIDYKKIFGLKKSKTIKPDNYFKWDYLPLKVFIELEKNKSMPVSRDNIYLVTGKGPSFNKISNIIEIDEYFSRFIGYYLSEGCISKDNSIRTRFTFNENERQYIDDVISIAKKLGISYSIWHNKKDHCIQVKISSNILGFLIKEVFKCGSNCYEKNIPSLILYNKKLCLSILSGIFRGDGSLKQDNRDNFNCCVMTFSSSSKVMFNQICYILLSNGIHYSTYINKVNPKVNHLTLLGGQKILSKISPLLGDKNYLKIGNHINNCRRNPLIKYEFSDGLWLVPVKEVFIENNEQEVFSIEVEKTKTIVTDFGIISHNCIGVDPYYLTYKAEILGYHPEVILSGRRTNDNMGKYIAENTIKKLIELGKKINGANILIMGITFKENISDIRNSRIGDIYKELKKYHTNPFVYDPKADINRVYKEYNIPLINYNDLCLNKPYEAIIVAVKHNMFKEKYPLNKLKEMSSHPPIIIDIKGLYDKEECIKNGFVYWRL